MVARPIAAAFHALADPNRRAILELLRDGERAAGQIADRFAISRPAVSKHLRVLLDAGLVACRSRGRERIYRCAPASLAAVRGWLEAGAAATGSGEPVRAGRMAPRPHRGETGGGGRRLSRESASVPSERPAAPREPAAEAPAGGGWKVW